MDALDPQESRFQPTARRTDGAMGSTFDPWRYRDDLALSGVDLTGYHVEAVDGGIGKVDEASQEVNAQCMVVDTGPWIFGKKVLLPAGTVHRVDHAERKVYVDRTKDQIKSAPEFEPNRYADPIYREKVGGYYGDSYTTTPPARPW